MPRISIAHTTRGFTLIELLIVTSLIALLIGLLLPSLQAARSASRRAGCASNIRQIAIANLAYATDNAGRCAPGAANFRENLERWHGRRQAVNQKFEPNDGPLSPYLGPEGAVRRCPSFQPDRSQPGTDFECGNGGYGYNNAYLGVDERGADVRGVKLSRISMASETVMFTDAAFALDFPELRIIEYSFAEPPMRRDRDAIALDPSIHFRHGDRSTVVWADAHVDVASMSYSKGNIYGVSEADMLSLGIGWFGPKMDNRLFDLD